MNPDNNIEEPVVEEKTYFNSVTPLSKYLSMFLFVVLPFVGVWVGYNLAPEKIVLVETKVAVNEVVEDKSGTNNHDSENMSAGAQKLTVFSFGCDAPSCLLLNEIDPATLDIKNSINLGGGYLDIYGMVDIDTVFYTLSAGDKLIIKDFDLDGAKLQEKIVTIQSLGMSSDYRFSSVESLGGALYLVLQSGEMINGEFVLSDAKLVKYDLSTGVASPINLSFTPTHIYAGFSSAKENHLYITTAKQGGEITDIHTFDVATGKVVDSKKISGCSESGPSVPCSATYSELSALTTYTCGDLTMSNVFTQDGSAIKKIENIKTGNSTSTNSMIYGGCM